VKLRPKEQLMIYKTSNETKIVTPTPGKEREKEKETVLKKTTIKEVVIKPNVRTELSTSWKDSKWIISDEPLALFVGNLTRRYNVNISFASEELKEYNFSGVFENETIEQILTALSLAAPINYKLNKNNVMLSLNEKDKDKFKKILKNQK
jgi:ferric-dicitrate binding protein FerR (iron transport regulator)